MSWKNQRGTKREIVYLIMTSQSVFCRTFIVLLVVVATTITCYVLFSGPYTFKYSETNRIRPCNSTAERVYVNYHINCTTDENSNTKASGNISHTNEADQQLEKLIPKLESLARSIHIARQHVRGIKTSEALKQAEETIVQSLKVVGRNWNTVTGRTLLSSKSVCPEYYMGFGYGHPLFETGYVVKKCSHGKPLSSLVSIVIAYAQPMQYQMLFRKLLPAIDKYDQKLKVLISAPAINQTLIDELTKAFKNVRIFNLESYSYGTAWNSLLKKVITPYSLIARDIMWFNKDARLDRIIRELERLNVSTVGGAARDLRGYWSFGCQQRAFRNHTLVYEAGYDISKAECLFCDHLDGPFVIKTKDALQTPFNERIIGQGLFEDYFLRLRRNEHVVCPDSMFFVSQTKRSLKANDWKNFASIWQIHRLKFSGSEVDITCPSSYRCRIKGGAISPCCQKELSDLVNKAMDVCSKLGVVCELEAGTLLGAVKAYSVLPWEVDADIMFLSSNYSSLNTSKSTFLEYGYKFTIERPENKLKCCFKNTTRPYSEYFAVRSRYWRLEYNGMPFLTSEKNLMDGMSPTLILLNRNWVRVPRNPGLVARNTYGKEVYRHALHASQSHKRGFPKTFLPCEQPGHPSCLDAYNNDGNLQFRDPIP